ncbi:MAG: hypothetical protein Q4G28_00535 [Neisseria sp.]|nr:hypothetical protein [Neisseria sp.]
MRTPSDKKESPPERKSVLLYGLLFAAVSLSSSWLQDSHISVRDLWAAAWMGSLVLFVRIKIRHSRRHYFRAAAIFICGLAFFAYHEHTLFEIVKNSVILTAVAVFLMWRIEHNFKP